MSFKQILSIRRFSTSLRFCRPQLSDAYKSSQLWEERLNCKLLSGDDEIIRNINNKIIMGTPLNNLDIDIFINTAAPHLDEIDQLQESVKMLSQFRKSIYAHTLLPSTPHALCRLFLYSKRLSSILNVLENRVNYGVFPDFFALNMLIDCALERNEYNIASRLANLVMLQEEFGINQITDCLSLYSVASYAELRNNFENWSSRESDPILEETSDKLVDSNYGKQKEEEANEEEEEEDEDEAEYIRVPFLRNPYFDNHFDLKNPRVLCGKTLSMLGSTFSARGDNEIGLKSKYLGSLLQGKWSEAENSLSSVVSNNLKLGTLKDLSKFYVENLHEVEAPSDTQKNSLMDRLQDSSDEGHNLSALAESRFKDLNELENQEIDAFRENLSSWSEQRLSALKAKEELEKRQELIDLIKKKKEELERREQYLYFYDNLKKSRVTRIDYD